MAKEKKKSPPAGETPETGQAVPQPEENEAKGAVKETAAQETVAEAAAEEVPADTLQAQLDEVRNSLATAEERFLRLAAEYDNFRKRTAKEKESIWNDATAAAVTALLPVFDNLERALKQETADAAYKKGVEMTMTGLRDAMAKLGVEEIPALGETFDPKLHNAVMHVEDENAEENTVVEVFQQGFRLGEKVLRFSMVKVAN